MYFSRRTMIAGELPNSPDNLVRWLRNPKAVEPGTAMPDLGLTRPGTRYCRLLIHPAMSQMNRG